MAPALDGGAVTALPTVVVTGSECTGKTTLAARLAAHYGTTWAPEFVREYLTGKGAALDASDVAAIARGQIAGEERAARAAHRVVILDTDLLSTTVYAEHYYGACPPWVLDAARARRADLYLLADIDTPWVADPQRDRPHQRDQMHALFRARLEAWECRYETIRGGWDERFLRARSAVDALLAEVRTRRAP